MKSVDVSVNLARRKALDLESSGQHEAAAQVLVQALRGHPDRPALHLQLGNLLAAQNAWKPALTCYAKACALQPDNAQAHHNRGVALQELGAHQEAIQALEAAITLAPHFADAFFAMGLSYQRLNALDSALLAFECAANIEPAAPGHRLEHARTLFRLGRHAQALAELQELATQHPGLAHAHNLMGLALKHLHRIDEAVQAFDRAVACQPDLVEAINNRANQHILARDFAAALGDLDRVAELAPRTDWLLGLRLYAALHVFDWRDFDERVAGLLRGVGAGQPCVQPLSLQCMVDDPAAQQAAARIWTHTACAPARPWTQVPRTDQDRKIRVAYVSRDFQSHPVSFLMAEVFELHDRSRFEVIAVNYGKVSDDPMQQRLRQAFDGFVDAGHLPDKEMAELVRALDVDVAIDLSGLTDGARTSVFSWRAAPVQVSYIGYLGTTGGGVHDYLVADATLVPPEARAFYDEKLIYLPSYQANDRQRPRPEDRPGRAALGLPENGFVFCCFNNPCKITPAVFDAWLTILRGVPGSVLWVLEEDAAAAANLRRHAQARGVDGDRIVLARRSSREAYLARLGAADLFLDTLPYNAGTTASDALWMGLPVLTQQGRSFAARMAASLLQAAGLPDLIAHSHDEYVDKAIRLATQPGELAAIRQRLDDGRPTCQLFDAPRFTRSLEHALGEAHRRHQAGLPATDLYPAAS